MKSRVLLFLIIGILISSGAGLYFWTMYPKKDAPRADMGNRKVSVVTTPAKNVDFPIRRRAIALVESPATVVILSRIDSQLAEQHVRDGQIVNKGDLLFVLDDREIKATVAKDMATIARDQALNEQAKADLKRALELFAKNSASQQQVDQAQANEKSTAATLAANKAILEADQLKQSYTRIYAPISGRIGSIRSTPGNLIKANDSSNGGLVTITQIQPLRVTFVLPERDLPLLRQSLSEGRNPHTDIVAPNTNAKTQGALDFMDNVVDSSSGTITAKASFANEKNEFWPGQYVHVDVILGTLPNVISIPTVALQIGQKGSYVFVVNDKNTVDIRIVEVLGSDQAHSAVSGLTPGERVVVEGQNRLTQGTAVNENRGERPVGPASANASGTSEGQK